MSQTTAPLIDSARGFSGQLADSHGPKDVLSSKSVKEAMPLGRLAVVDTANGDDAAMLPVVTGDITNLAKGVVVHSHSQESLRNSNDPEWPQNDVFPTLSKGRVYVSVEDAVTDGSPVFARHTAPFGAFRSDVDAGAATLVPGAVYRSSTTGAGIAVLEMNLPA